jgi:L-amino acid N-acyltransferase YncA
MHIREATSEDFQALVEIGHKFFAFNAYRKGSYIDEESLLNTFWDLLDDHVLLVVEADGKVVGTAAAFIAPVYWNRHHLQGLEAFWWIDEAYRKQGAGSTLRKTLQEAAKQKGARFWNMIALKESMHDQVCAQYERDGMIPVETVYMKVL